MHRLYFLLLVLLSNSANAAYYYYLEGSEKKLASPDAVCADYIERLNGGYTGYQLRTDGHGTVRCYIRLGTSNSYWGGVPIYRGGSPDPPTTPPTTKCTAGTTGTATLFGGIIDKSDAQVGDYRLPTTYGGCTMKVVDVGACWSSQKKKDAGINRESFCKFTFNYSGEESPAGSPKDNEGNPGKSDNNGCPDGFQNIAITKTGVVCASKNPQDAPQFNTSEKTEKKTDGSIETTTTDKTTVRNGDGTSTVTTSSSTTTQRPDGTTVKGPTATTVTSVGGGTKGDGTDRDDFCKSNPGFSLCKESQFAGSCSNFTCSGDAIQCAIARRQHEDSCQLRSDRDLLARASYTSLGNQLLNGNDPLKAELPSPKNGTTVSVGSINSAGFLGNAQCLADKTFVVHGQSITVPLSSSCQYFLILRMVIMSTAALVALRIVSGSIKG